MSRVREALPQRTDLARPPAMGEFRPRLGSTRSGRAKLIELGDEDARGLEPGAWLVARFAYGLSPVQVIRVKTGVAGEGEPTFEVPVIEARIPTGQVLVYAPEDLCRVRESKGGRS